MNFPLWLYSAVAQWRITRITSNPISAAQGALAELCSVTQQLATTLLSYQTIPLRLTASTYSIIVVDCILESKDVVN
ncbi:MAG: hypothetical protein RR313_12580, partial [Anaerovoracaceae bacterium]